MQARGKVDSEKMGSFFFIFLVTILMFKLALAAKIAGFSGISSGSQYLMVKKVMEELDSRGHEVRPPSLCALHHS